MSQEFGATTYTWQSPVTGVITSGFGYRTNPVLGTEELHNGIDIAADIGTKALAACDGVVTDTGRSPTYGIYVTFDTTDGYQVFYAHLSKALVQEGDRVKKGDVIALTGDTGLATGPHLHYSVFRDGKPLDPLSLPQVVVDSGP